MLAGLLLTSCAPDITILEKHATIRYQNLAVPPAVAGATWLSVDFVGLSTGFIGGEKGALLSTTTAGASWQELTDTALGDILQLHFSSPSTGLALTTTGLYRTTAAGRSWTRVKHLPLITDVQMLDASTGFLVGEKGLLSKTTDGGRTWRDYVFPVWPPVNTDFRAVAFATEQVGLAVGANQCFRTRNGGSTWESVEWPMPYRVFDLHLYPNGTDYLVSGIDDLGQGKSFRAMTYDAATRQYQQVSAQDLLNVPVYDFAQWQGEVVGVGWKTVLRNFPAYAAQPEVTPWVNLAGSTGQSLQHVYRSADFADATTLYAVGEAGTVSRFDYR
ncbi:WD40/YVTN/BNR-like repeat-containing protein [Hymenobacter puniceus]|uniref:WD40/YVTN/BNR-like repeat-containing protein n=1 Tax=Hymenobacter sp. BT190 TaxID=2763505 RepID=UPI0016516B2F|nr:YCF48-related protein [Hymenobacter sp. BT190]MBC6698571.1 hypothetical protein [Hymenobacter sp. BT190]